MNNARREDLAELSSILHESVTNGETAEGPGQLTKALQHLENLRAHIIEHDLEAERVQCRVREETDKRIHQLREECDGHTRKLHFKLFLAIAGVVALLALGI